MGKKLLIGASTIALFFAAAACSDDGGDDAGAPNDDGGIQDGGALEPDLEGIPDVVAEVNGEEIDKDEFVTAYEGHFQQRAMEAQQTGEEVDQDQLKEETAQNLVDNQILTQEAEDRGFSASAEDIDELLDEIAMQNGLESTDDFVAAMEEQGMAEDELKSEVEAQVQVEQLITDEAGDISPSEEKLQELYDEAEAEQEAMGGGEGDGEMPPFEEVAPQLEEQAQAEKEAEVVDELLAELQEEADVTIHL